MMALETRLNLSDETIAAVQDLIQINIDSRDGFRHAAGNIENLTLSEVFDYLADQRDLQADELSSYVMLNGEPPRHAGSFLATVHRTWMDIREMLASNNTIAVLEEAERGEDTIKEAYCSVRPRNWGSWFGMNRRNFLAQGGFDEQEVSCAAV